MTETFLYTEIQASIPFDQFDWEQANAPLEQAPGLLSKTWLAGLSTHTIGGCISSIPPRMHEALLTARGLRWPGRWARRRAPESSTPTTEAASRDMDSPYYD